MKTYLTRRIQFSAAHRYSRPEWSEQKNLDIFGPCANPHGHGHTYTLEVMVAGMPDAQTGFSVDLDALDRLLRKRVFDRLDHQHINHAIPEFAEGQMIPTTENLAIWIWAQLESGLGDAELARVRLREADDLFVDYYGPGEAREGRRPGDPIEV